MHEDLLARITAQAQRTPSALAIVERGERSICYRELLARVEQLGSALFELGAGPEQVVALGLSKSIDYVVSALACWYAGAAFLPLDPGLPLARQRDYLSRAAVRMVITHAATPTETGLRFVSPDHKGTQRRPRAEVDLERLAYVIFTSGSQGAPKGVEVCQRGLVPLLDAQIEAFCLGPGHHSLWLLATAFDASISDMGSALMAGACLHIEDDALLHDPSRLLQTLHARSIHYVDLPPALLPHLDVAQLPPSLHTVVVGGEPCDAQTVRRWAKQVRLVNVYGPTEATVCTSLSVCTTTWDRALLGTEITGVRYSIRSSEGEQLRPGEPGELWIAGACLARGYLGHPDLTATRFVLHAGERWYRTGDRVVRHADGGLEFLGRIDRQVKVRGVLIAPEEIEAELLRHPAIRRAAVVQSGTPSVLTAWLEGEQQSASELRAFLIKHLPQSMVPARFVFLPELPKTTSGKPDLHQLSQHAVTERALTPPATSTEHKIAQLFTQQLGPAVGREDDFFALGGSSIQLLAVIAAAAQLGLPLHSELFYRDATVAGLATALTDRGAKPVVATRHLRTLVHSELNALKNEPNRLPAGDTNGAFFVTGATGFLGSRIVHNLLRQTERDVVCLVRADSLEHGRSRILATMRNHCLELSTAEAARLVPMCGDVALKGLGLGAEEHANLAARVDCVFHCAALVSHMAEQEAHWQTNLKGTRHVLQLASQGRAKAVHYASTLSVFVADEPVAGTFSETDPLERSGHMHGGYAQSKWAAELLIREQQQPGVRAFIYRLGLLTGDSQTGRGPSQDWLTLTIRALAELGVVPRDRPKGLAFDVTPIDYAANAMVALALRSDSQSDDTVHLCGPEPVLFDQLLDAMRASGVALQEVDNDQFHTRIAALSQQTSSAALTCAQFSLQRLTAPSYRPDLDLFRASDCRFDDQHARDLLRPLEIHCPAASKTLLERYMRDILALG